MITVVFKTIKKTTDSYKLSKRQGGKKIIFAVQAVDSMSADKM